MKTLFLLSGLLAAQPLFAAPATPTTPPADPIVREYVQNTSYTDWSLAGGWAWNNGALVHYNGAPGVAEPVAMPALEVGKQYRVSVSLSGRTKGSVTVAVGNDAYTFTGNATYVEGATPVSPDATLKISTTADYDGSIDSVSVVQLGDELLDNTGWTLNGNWTQDGASFRHAPGSAASLDRTLPIVAGHTYQLYYHVADPADGQKLLGNGYVYLGAEKFAWFSQQGGWNFRFDFKAAVDTTLSFVPTETADGTQGFNGVLTDISVREITSDVPAPPAVPTAQQ